MFSAFAAVKSECLKPIANAFGLNLLRTGNFAILPAELLFQSRRDGRFESNAVYRATGRGDLSLAEMLSIPITPEIERAMDEQTAEFDKLSSDEERRLKARIGLGLTEVFLNRNPQMADCMDALLTSITLESWLFFEAFASDLWVAGVDNWTPPIAARMSANRQWEKSDTKAASALRISANAHTHRGSFWREIGMVSFESLRLIKQFFGIAFGSDAEKLFDSTEAGYIRALSAFRNCIAHRAGKVDLKFKEDTQRFPEFNSLNLGDAILLDGDIVKRLRNAAAEMGLALLSHVDEMLQSGI